MDSKGCFMINIIIRRKTNKIGWQIRPCFQRKLHIKDKDLLLQIKSFFFSEVGTIIINYNYDFVVYKIFSLNDIISIIIPHFCKHLLITQKYNDHLFIDL